MGWSARRWSGDDALASADLGALFAATAGLTNLHQALADRRLEAAIAHTNDGWRTLLVVGSIAAPLWLADALVMLAGAFYDTETSAHPDRPASINPSTHDLVAALLWPVQDIIADITAAVADPNHHTALAAPLHVGPNGAIGRGPLPDPVPRLYARGLADGARRVHTAAATALLDARQALVNTTPPDWLMAGLARLDGELQAAGARLDMDEAQLATLAAGHGPASGALAPICRTLWSVVDTAFVAGQAVADPHLLPEAPAASRQPAVPTARPPAPAPARSHADHPGHREEPPRSVALPEISEGAPNPDAHPAHPHATNPTQPAAQNFVLPTIGSGLDTSANAAGSPMPRMPNIGEADMNGPGQQAEHTGLPAVGEPGPGPRGDVLPSGKSQPTGDDKPVLRLPEIG